MGSQSSGCPDTVGPGARVRAAVRALASPRGVVLLATLAALLVRLWGLDARIFSHPENFVPGLDVPDWAQYPPERRDLLSILRSTLVDGHPPTYFVALLPWVKIFGTGLTALRLPSALLGAASVWLLYRIGVRETGAKVAALAAVLLAFHGHHVYWSQMARMYVPTAFLVLLSVLWTWRTLEDDRLSSHLMCFGTTAAALWTQVYAWPVAFAQMVWIAVGATSGARRGRALRAQWLALVVSMPVVQLALVQNPGTRWHAPALPYLQLGYLFPGRLPFWDGVPWAPPAVALLLLTVTLLVLGARGRSSGSGPPSDTRDAAGTGRRKTDPSEMWDWALAVATAGGMAVFLWRWVGWDRPLIAGTVALPLVLAALRPVVESLLDRAAASARWRAVGAALDRLSPSAFLALIPPALMLSVSAVRGVWVERGTVVFLPFLLLVVARGVYGLVDARRRPLPVLGYGTLAAVVILHVLSVGYVRAASSSPRDYRTLGKELERRMGPDDLLLVRDNYITPPLYYYLDPQLYDQLVHESYPEVVASRDPPRVWTIRFGRETPGSDLSDAVATRVPVDTLRGVGFRALLWVAPDSAGTGAGPPGESGGG